MMWWETYKKVIQFPETWIYISRIMSTLRGFVSTAAMDLPGARLWEDSLLSQFTMWELVTRNSREGFMDGKAGRHQIEPGSRPISRANQKFKLKSFIKHKNTPTHDDISPKGHSDADLHLKTGNSGVLTFPRCGWMMWINRLNSPKCTSSQSQ